MSQIKRMIKIARITRNDVSVINGCVEIIVVDCDVGIISITSPILYVESPSQDSPGG
jgi:hypothetical protein